MRNTPRWAVGLLLIGVLGIAVWLVWRCRYDGAIHFLPGDSRAEWIVYPNPPSILAHKVPTPGSELATVFRRELSVQKVPASAVIEVRALEAYGITVNGRPVSKSNSAKTWK